MAATQRLPFLGQVPHSEAMSELATRVGLGRGEDEGGEDVLEGAGDGESVAARLAWFEYLGGVPLDEADRARLAAQQSESTASC